jgi:hypothetical protein
MPIISKINGGQEYFFLTREVSIGAEGLLMYPELREFPPLCTGEVQEQCIQYYNARSSSVSSNSCGMYVLAKVPVQMETSKCH